MMGNLSYDTIDVDISDSVATIFLNRPPTNFFNIEMIEEIVTALGEFDQDEAIRVVILAARGKAFCAGADFNSSPTSAPGGSIYHAGRKMLLSRKPIIAAVQGAAIGGGLGLACVADFRVTCPEARLSANFCRIGFHPGFGLTAFLPRLVGQQAATRMMYTGERIAGDAAVAMGLADILAPDVASVLGAAKDLAAEIATSAPLAVLATRETMRRGWADMYEEATNRERIQQDMLRGTSDFAEGVRAYTERRRPQFCGA
jgi:enoyl-CoA hydratase/carnithine racemase